MALRLSLAARYLSAFTLSGWRRVILTLFVIFCATSTSSLVGAQPSAQADASPAPKPDAIATQEIGALLGTAMGGGVTPGGVALDGRYLYRLSDLDWFETGANFVLGGGSAECFRDRQSTLVCEHGLVDGFAAEFSGGIRRYFTGQQQFRPYLRASVGLRILSFSGDSLRGVAVPITGGAGLRVDVANRVLIVAEASLSGGPAILGRGLGIEPNLGLAVSAGVEFTLE